VSWEWPTGVTSHIDKLLTTRYNIPVVNTNTGEYMGLIQEQLDFIESNVRIFDNPRYNDRYTAVFMHKPQFKTKDFECLGMSQYPFAPNGVGQMTCGYPGEHLGKRITYEDLPQDCQKLLVSRLFNN